MVASQRNVTVGKRPVGRPRVDFCAQDRMEILKMLGQGIGRREICHRLRIGYERFLRNLRDSPFFADEVTSLEEKRAEQCAGFLYQVATGPYPADMKMKAAIAFLGRKDRVDAANFARLNAMKKAEAKDAEKD